MNECFDTSCPMHPCTEAECVKAQDSIVKVSHPDIPELKYRYIGPMNLIGYARTKKDAERTLAAIKQRYKQFDAKKEWARFSTNTRSTNAKNLPV